MLISFVLRFNPETALIILDFPTPEEPHRTEVLPSKISLKSSSPNPSSADVNKISYIEALERKTFVYTEDEMFESKLKLYEMEERLCHCGFIRISKSCLVHLKYIKSIRNDIERKLRLTMKNDEQIIVSRQYADEIKKRLGVM